MAEHDLLIFICPHHHIAETADATGTDREQQQVAEYLHDGDLAFLPVRVSAASHYLLAGLEVPIENRFGRRPAVTSGGSPALAEIDRSLDSLDLLQTVETFNLHSHLPQLVRIGLAIQRIQVLARQAIDSSAASHPFTLDGRTTFDAPLQSRSSTFA